MKSVIWACVGTLVLAAAASAEEKKDKFDAAKLVGKWEYVSGVKNGEKANADNLKEKVVIEKDKLTLEGPMKFVMSYKLDTSKTPAVISLTITESPFGAGATAEGIIEMAGEELKFAYTPMGKAPEKFESKEGSMVHYFVLKKAK